MTSTDIALVILILAFVFSARAIRIVPQQTVYILERLGKFHGELHAGLHFIVPFIDRVAYQLTIKEVPMDVAPQICITKDNTQVHIDGILYYQVTDPRLACYGTANYEFAIEQLAKTMLRSEAGKRELDLLLEARGEINQAVVAALDEASGAWGVKVLRYEVKDITPPESILQAMELQIKAVREKRAVIARSEGQRQEQINKAEGAQQAAVMTSDGERQAAINRAEGEARSIALVADATAAAIRVVAAAIETNGGEKAIQLKVAEKYVESFGHIAKAGNTVVVPADMSNMAGLITAAMQIVGKHPAS
jgi:regulator of protease activity HflC (stomatin/prohibitin superfamily)